jgi:lysozyme
MAKKSTITAATICAALAIAIPFIDKHEGLSLKSYEDVAGVWTVCSGIAHVSPEDQETPEQCAAMTNSSVGQFMQNVAHLITVPVTAPTLAAHTSLAYNIGINAYSKSQALEFTNAGNIAAGCRAMLNWFTAGGKDCRIRSNNCWGVWARRQDEETLCLKGIQP